MGTASSWHWPSRSRGRRPRPLLLAIATYICSSLVIFSILLCPILLWGQAPGSPGEGVNTSSTDTIQPQYSNVNPTRTTESHTHSGNRTQDNRSVQRLGTD